MSSATMMNHSRRQIPPPVLTSNKRSDGILDGGVKPSAITTKSLAKPSIHRPAAAPSPSPSSAAAEMGSSPALRTPQQQPGLNNKLLAGYLAHEFLSKGTLFGEAWEAPVAVPFSPSSSSSSSTSSTSRGGGGGGEKRRGEWREKEGEKEKKQRYMEVAQLLKGNGTYISGVVNPSQLARYLQLR